jgi:outer membrane protein assembly factor BamA
VNLERFGFVTEVSRVFGRYLRTSLRTEYQSIRPLNPDEFSVIELPRADQPIEEATVGPAFFYDRRDDPIDPHRGYYVSLAGKYAFPLSSAERATPSSPFRGRGSSLWDVAPSSRSPGRWGGIFPYGSAAIPVPIAERFFVGGRSTGRRVRDRSARHRIDTGSARRSSGLARRRRGLHDTGERIATRKTGRGIAPTFFRTRATSTAIAEAPGS